MKQKNASFLPFTILLIVVIAIVLVLPPLFGQFQQQFTPRNPQDATVIADFAAPAPVVGVVVNKNLQVTTVEALSAAERLGIQEGDVITAVHNVQVTTINELRQVIENSPGKVVLPTETMNTTPGMQEIMDATAVAVAVAEQDNSSPRFTLPLTLLRNGLFITVQVDKQPSNAHSVSTPTAVPEDSYYF